MPVENLVVSSNKVVSMNYTLTDEAGAVLDSSSGEPLSFLHGHQNIIPGLEKALTGLKPGDQKKVQVPPEEGYGVLNPELCFTLGLAQFGNQVPEPGMMVQMNTDQGETFVATILKIENGMVYLDGNHPLAGKALIFDVEITEVRDATQEEITHGHPHGPHGHHH